PGVPRSVPTEGEGLNVFVPPACGVVNGKAQATPRAHIQPDETAAQHESIIRVALDEVTQCADQVPVPPDFIESVKQDEAFPAAQFLLHLALRARGRLWRRPGLKAGKHKPDEAEPVVPRQSAGVIGQANKEGRERAVQVTTLGLGSL